MADRLTILGYRYSVYTRIARMALTETGLTAAYSEVDPFAPVPDPVLAAHTPFGRVPVLCHNGFTLTETQAILRYLDRLSGSALVPSSPRGEARMAQVIGITDAYGYVPMVRQVFANAVFAPRMGDPADDTAIAAGLADARPVLSALDAIAAGGLCLNGRDITLADLHLAPMIGYFVMSPQGAKALADHPALARWWAVTEKWPTLVQTDPFAGQ